MTTSLSVSAWTPSRYSKSALETNGMSQATARHTSPLAAPSPASSAGSAPACGTASKTSRRSAEPCSAWSFAKSAHSSTSGRTALRMRSMMRRVADLEQRLVHTPESGRPTTREDQR